MGAGAWIRRVLLFAACGLLLGSGPAAAQLYAVRDADGRVVIRNRSKGERSPGGQTMGVRTTGTTGMPGSAATVVLGERRRFDHHVREAARRHGVSPDLIHAVIKVESNYNPQAVSRQGALGLMQLMPETAEDMGLNDPFDPRQNILAGSRYLRMMLDTFEQDLDLSLAAYNAGPERVVEAGGVPRIRETREYVRRVKERLAGRRTTVVRNVAYSSGPSRSSRPVRLVRDSRGVPLLTNRP